MRQSVPITDRLVPRVPILSATVKPGSRQCEQPAQVAARHVQRFGLKAVAEQQAVEQEQKQELVSVLSRLQRIQQLQLRVHAADTL